MDTNKNTDGDQISEVFQQIRDLFGANKCFELMVFFHKEELTPVNVEQLAKTDDSDKWIIRTDKIFHYFNERWQEWQDLPISVVVKINPIMKTVYYEVFISNTLADIVKAEIDKFEIKSVDK